MRHVFYCMQLQILRKKVNSLVSGGEKNNLHKLGLHWGLYLGTDGLLTLGFHAHSINPSSALT